jgi:type IV secretion system protein TrbL
MGPGKYVWLDAPFFSFLERFAQIQSYFTGVTWDIARVVVILCLGFMFLRYAMTGEGLKENLTKFLLSFVIYGMVIANYPRMITGINDLIYSFSVESTYVSIGGYVESLQDYAEKVRMEHLETIRAEADAEAAVRRAGRANAYLKLAEAEKRAARESFDIASFIEEELFEENTKYIRPNSMIKLIMMVCGEIWSSSPRNLHTIGQTLLDFLCMAAVVLCGIFGSAQYFIGALEFSLVTAVGVIFIPFMLWDGTKFITEKFIGALLGFFLKMLFLTICILFTYYGFLELTLRPYTGSVEQVIYFVFSAVFYMMITQNGPKLAVTLLTGTPQMSIMEAAQAAGVYGGAAYLGKKAVGAAVGAAARGGFAAAGAHTRAAGAADFAKSEGAGRKEQRAAYMSSVRSSMKEGIAARASNTGRSLLAGGGGGGFIGGRGGGGGGGSGGGGARGYNRHSQLERFNQPNEKGQNLTMKEHLGKQYSAGQEDGLNYMIKQEERARRVNPPQQGRSLGGGGKEAAGAGEKK